MRIVGLIIGHVLYLQIHTYIYRYTETGLHISHYMTPRTEKIRGYNLGLGLARQEKGAAARKCK